VISTGGTIAGKSSSIFDTTDYTPAQLKGEDLLGMLPPLPDTLSVETETVFNVPSTDIDETMLVRLGERIEAQLDRADVAGVVVTHGTSTLEDTAFYLSLSLHSSKPVVIVGAMRPGTAVSADGPMNLAQAIVLAASEQARGMGVMMVANDKIYPGLHVMKTQSQAVEAFAIPDQGLMGSLTGLDMHFYRPALPRTRLFPHPEAPAADLPRVDILYVYKGFDADLIDYAIERHACQGLVLIASGNGIPPVEIEARAQALMQADFPVVLASRVQQGYISQKTYGIGAGFMSPRKAQLLLAMALRAGYRIPQLVRLFSDLGTSRQGLLEPEAPV